MPGPSGRRGLPPDPYDVARATYGREFAADRLYWRVRRDHDLHEMTEWRRAEKAKRDPRFDTCSCSMRLAVLESFAGKVAFADDKVEHYFGKALRGAFRKGLAAFEAGEPINANPYRDVSRWGHTDRRGRYNRGFQSQFEFWWRAGWAYGEWTDPAEAAMRVLAGGAPPSIWTRYLAASKAYSLALAAVRAYRAEQVSLSSDTLQT